MIKILDCSTILKLIWLDRALMNYGLESRKMEQENGRSRVLKLQSSLLTGHLVNLGTCQMWIVPTYPSLLAIS